jgi:cell wall-associated NlpC family hydrolase
MIPRSLSQLGAIAIASRLPLSACTTATLGVSPETILATVIANIPSSVTPTDSRRPRTERRIPASPPPSAEAARVLHTADAYLGTRYVWGGSTPNEGFDCSGFTKYVFARYHVTLPRTSREQAHTGRAVGQILARCGRGEASAVGCTPNVGSLAIGEANRQRSVG